MILTIISDYIEEKNPLKQGLKQKPEQPEQGNLELKRRIH